MAIQLRKLSEQQWILLLTAVALLIRLIGINTHSYWFDEAREVGRALTPWPDILLVTEGTDPPLYRLLLFPIAQQTISEFWLRLPSALFSAASVYLSYLWLRDWGLRQMGVITAVFFAFSPVQLFYAREVSQYSLVVFLSLLLLITYQRAARSGQPRDWVWLAIVNIIAIYSYYGLAFLLPILDLYLAWQVWQRHNRARILGFVGFHIAIALSILALYLLLLQMHIDRFATRKGLTLLLPNWGLGGSIERLWLRTQAGIVSFFTMPFSDPAPQLIGTFVLLCFLAGAFVLWRKAAVGKQIVVTLVVAIVMMFIANGLGFYPFGNRYALMVLPLFFACLAAAIFALQKRPLFAALLFTLLIGIQVAFMPILPTAWNPWVQRPQESLRPLLAELNAQAAPGDHIYVYYGAIPAYRVYQPSAQLPTTYGTWFRNWPISEKVSEIQTAVAGHERFWLVMTHIDGAEDVELIAGLQTAVPRYETVHTITEDRAIGVLFQRAEEP